MSNNLVTGEVVMKSLSSCKFNAFSMYLSHVYGIVAILPTLNITHYYIIVNNLTLRPEMSYEKNGMRKSFTIRVQKFGIPTVKT